MGASKVFLITCSWAFVLLPLVSSCIHFHTLDNVNDILIDNREHLNRIGHQSSDLILQTQETMREWQIVLHAAKIFFALGCISYVLHILRQLDDTGHLGFLLVLALVLYFFFISVLKSNTRNSTTQPTQAGANNTGDCPTVSGKKKR